jgi:hypothetical protein
MDKELQAIVDIEKILDGMKWEVKNRVIGYVQSRIEYDPLTDGNAQLASPIGKLNRA